jgi:tRNA(Ile2) C34 agmatinyltransferase TiaS
MMMKTKKAVIKCPCGGNVIENTGWMSGFRCSKCDAIITHNLFEIMERVGIKEGRQLHMNEVKEAYRIIKGER